MADTTEILANVVWLVNVLDDQALSAVQDIPLLEMAKAVAVAPLPVGFITTSQALERRTLPRYPTAKETLMKRTT